MRRIIVVESRSFVTKVKGDSLALAQEMLESDGYAVSLLTKGQSTLCKINGTTYKPPEVSLKTVMADEHATEGAIAEWIVENVKALLTKISLLLTVTNSVYVTIKEPEYSMYSADEIFIQCYISIIMI